MKAEVRDLRSLAAWSLAAVVAVLLAAVASPCTGNSVHQPTLSYLLPVRTPGAGLYGAFPGPYAPTYLYQPIYLTNPGYVSTPIIYNYFPALPADQAPALSANGSTPVQVTAGESVLDERAEELLDNPAFKIFPFGRVEAKAELFWREPAAIANSHGYVYFATDAATKGTTALGLISFLATNPPSEGSGVIKIGASNNCQNAQPTEIYNPSSVPGGGRVHSYKLRTSDANKMFFIERSVPEDVISLTGSRSIIGRTVLVSPTSATAPDGETFVALCGVIVRA